MPIEDARSLERDFRRFGMRLDEHCERNSHYDITSLYFDSLTNQHYDDKDDGLIERKKIRLRSYHLSLYKPKNINLEIKFKFDAKNTKIRLGLTQAESRNLIDHGPETLRGQALDHHPDKSMILRCFYEANAKPSVYVRYKRRAYLDAIGEVRITFDSDIEGAEFLGSNSKISYLPVHKNLMLIEIKFQYILPPWFNYIKQAYDLTRLAHSKFALSLEQLNRVFPLS